ncbi:MAG TPA: MBL fold metallo-hydrolase [Gemmatimonadaceae bacterium]|jgi:glyoxylase-like metal-dependent hydrolase (beta-lactamase superfamily II)|nr:MBL fold metallo-hydrolase [Gemmatimonadaceae bacterium]
MIRRLTLACSAASVLLTSGVRAQVNYDTVQVRTIQLARGVYMLTGSGGNMGLSVGDDAAFLVDDQFAPLTPKILAAIAAITPKPVRFVVNTHWHFDHTGGNENLGKTGALLVAHDNVRRRMSTGLFVKALNSQQAPAPKAALPMVTFTETVTFHINGDSLVATHVPPAHTDGDAIVRFIKANVIHMGDVFHNAGLPFVDRSSGGSIDGVITTADMALGMADAQTKIIPGHGPLADRARLKAWRDALFTLREQMRAEILAGKTVDQVLAANMSAAYAKDWPAGHERFIRTLYEELSGR